MTETSLRVRLAAMVLGVMVALLGLYALIFLNVALPAFERLQQEDIARNMVRVSKALDREVEAVLVFTNDWSSWDDTYAYMETRDAAYERSNLVPNLFEQARLNLIYFLDSEGGLIWGKAWDIEAGAELDLPQFPAAGLPAGHPLLRTDTDSEPLGGLYPTAHGLMMLAARPILNSDMEGPVRGTLVMGRLITPRVLAAIGDAVQTGVSIWPVADSPAPEMSLYSVSKGTPPIAIHALPGNMLQAHGLLRDVFGGETILVRIDVLGELAVSGQRTMRLSFVAAALGGLVLLATVIFLMHRLVARPLDELNRRIAALYASGDPSARLEFGRRDEIGRLAEAFDELLDRLSDVAEERERARDRLLDGIRSIAEGFVLWDAEDRLVQCNDRFKHMLPLIADRLRPGVTFLDVSRASVNSGQVDIGGAEMVAWLTRRLAEHRSPNAPIIIRTSDDRWIEVRERRTAEGGIVGVYADVTADRLAQERMRAMLKELERSNAELEQFAYVASHDLQEPLRMVASYTQLLSRRYRGRLDRDADDFIDFAVDGALRMQALINDLLTYSRVGRQGRPFEPVDANEALRAALGNLRAAIEESCAEITAAELPTVLADSGQMVQLFQNLIGNAIKYHKPGERPRIAVSIVGEDGWWRFSIADAGIGIPSAFSERVFMIFQRLHTREHYSGTGIGLALCRKIVDRHGGHIWVDSIEGEGSSFHFTLPGVPLGTPGQEAMAAVSL